VGTAPRGSADGGTKPADAMVPVRAVSQGSAAPSDAPAPAPTEDPAFQLPLVGELDRLGHGLKRGFGDLVRLAAR
jgi:hypothetical protein